MTTTAVVNYDEILAQRAAALSKKLAPPSGDKIRVTQSKKFVFPDGTESPGPFNAVILDFVSANEYYANPFVRGEFSPPDCFAIHEEPAQLKPSKNAPKPQSESCSSCHWNQYRTARQGNGKACKNTRLLALLPADADASTPIWLLSISPTGIQHWDRYAATIFAQFGATPARVVTTIAFDPKEDFPSVRFGNPVPLEDDKLPLFVSRLDQARDRLLVEPDYSNFQKKEESQPAAPQRSAMSGGAARPTSRVVR